MDPSKEATFKVAPSKWEAVEEAELQAQGETFRLLHTNVHIHAFFTVLMSFICSLAVTTSKWEAIEQPEETKK